MLPNPNLNRPFASKYAQCPKKNTLLRKEPERQMEADEVIYHLKRHTGAVIYQVLINDDLYNMYIGREHLVRFILQNQQTLVFYCYYHPTLRVIVVINPSIAPHIEFLPVEAEVEVEVEAFEPIETIVSVETQRPSALTITLPVLPVVVPKAQAVTKAKTKPKRFKVLSEEALDALSDEEQVAYQRAEALNYIKRSKL